MTTGIQNLIWRHICVNVADLITTASGVDYVWIEIPLELRIQGGYPLDSKAMMYDGIQLGYLCQHQVVTPPSIGTLYYADTGWWFTLDGNPPPTYPIVFEYKLQCLGQDSLVKTVTINI